jgi:hypothetical protein
MLKFLQKNIFRDKINLDNKINKTNFILKHQIRTFR